MLLSRVRLARVLQGDLREPGDARLHVAHPLLEVGDRQRQLLGQLGPLGARPDDAHVPQQHVQELRKLVESGSPQESPHLGDARVVRPLATTMPVCFSASGRIDRNLSIENS